MRNAQYQDLILHFSYEGSRRQTQSYEARLQVFSSEQDLFGSREGRSEASTAIWSGLINLPIDWMQGIGISQRELSRAKLDSMDMKAVGKALWSALPEDIFNPLSAATPDQPCRIRISSNSSVIDDLPWEWLGDDGGPFALRPCIRLSRSIPVRLGVPPLRVEPPLRVLLVLTNPKDENLLNSWKEIEAVRPRLSQPPYDLRILEEPTWGGLLDSFRSYTPHIVHYIGHAGITRGGGNLILHDWRNGSDWISAQELSQSLPPTVRLFCLSTCYTAPNYQILGLSRLAHSSTLYQLPTTIANRYPISEISVKLFWEAFYSELAHRWGNINDAFSIAQRRVLKMGSPATDADWGSYSLVIRDQTGVAFRLETGGATSDAQYIENIKAQLTSQLANELSERFLKPGTNVPKSLQIQIDQQATDASELSRKIDESDNL